MHRRVLCCFLFSTLALLAGDARAQSAFVEGHVFNFKSGRPIADAKVEVFVCAPECLAPFGRLAGSDTTDANGFYEVDLSEVPIGFDANIRVGCQTSAGVIRGSSDTSVRDETLRRDVYLRASVDLVRCGDWVLR